MGERLQVKLTIFASMREEVKLLSEEEPDEVEDYEDDQDGLITLTFNEVNYGELSFYSDMERNGIPYSAWNEASHEYEGQTRHMRFTPEGEVTVCRVGDDSGYSIGIGDLVAAKDDHEKLKQLIQDKLDETFVLPWTSQEKYRKTYLMREMIDPSE